MTKLQNIKNIYETIVGALISILCVYILNCCESNLPQNKTFKALFIIIFVSILIIVFNRLIFGLFANSALIRRLIDKSNFIEGFWYDITYLDSSIIHILILTITYENSSYTLSGEAFDPFGNKISTFNSSHSCYSNHELVAILNCKYKDKKLDRSLDYYAFAKSADSYDGFYIDINGRYNDIAGLKISKKSLKEFNNFKFLDDKKRFTQSIINKITK